MDAHVHPKERRYFAIAVVVSAFVYLLLVVTLVGLIYVPLGFAFFIIVQGIFTGRLRGNGVLVTPRQFPEVHALAAELSQRMGLAPVPEVYIVQEGGILNAFATRFLGRNFVVIYSDILELAYESGEAEVAFVLAHELAHLKLGHLWKRALIYPALIVPFLPQAYSRACEYSCDAIGNALRPDGSVGGLLALAAGKRLYRSVDAAAFAEQGAQPDDLWVWLAEHAATHPNLPKRLRTVLAQGAAPLMPAAVLAG
jgi:Zn-dependent protease with chaperone function